jgi:hypothetical protein
MNSKGWEKPGVEAENQVWIAEKGGTFINPQLNYTNYDNLYCIPILFVCKVDITIHFQKIMKFKPVKIYMS